MTCNKEQYESVCKDEFCQLHEKLDRMDEAIRGNGKPGIQVRLDRLEQYRLLRTTVTWFIIGCTISLASSIATTWIAGMLP